ncbi:MAG: galactose mutarotase [Rhodospirillales bacterium]|jgi:aldose 1-epimerase|nr:galactose mutarotase [Rhodospirillales bacterium]
MSGIEKTRFGELDGREVSLYTLTNSGGLVAKITDYGGILTEMHIPDAGGANADVVLGFDTLQPYLDKHPFFGALVGRYGNRISGARFELDGVEYRLAANQGPAFVNHLHGGTVGFDKKVWDAETRETADGPELILRYVSGDMEEGYPGALTVEAVYRLGEDNALELEFTATTDKPTVINLVNHSYWNLAGAGSGDILDHTMRLEADAYTPTDEADIPTGEVAAVAGTAYDFREAKAIARDVPILPEGVGGYDMNFVVNGKAGELRTAAVARDPSSGREMEVCTNAPGVQLYTAFKLDGSLSGKGGVKYGPSAGFCLETQHYPDSPNNPQFPSVVLRPGETYSHRTLYKFSAK